MSKLSDPVGQLPRVHKKIIPALRKLGIKKIQDLLLYFPARYEDFSLLKKIAELSAGETATVSGEIASVKTIRTFRQKMFLTEAVVKDDSGKIKAVWFNQPFLANTLKEGQKINLSGKVVLGPKGLHLQNPAHERLDSKYSKSETSPIHTGGLVAVYPETRGLTSRWLRFLIRSALDLRGQLIDPLPAELRKKYNLPEIRQAILYAHFPKNQDEGAAAKKRFDFQELLIAQLHSLKEKITFKQNPANAVKIDLELLRSFTNSLPYQLTNAQRRSIWEIASDMSRPHPMNRLLQGDVGSGKTVVAAAPALLAVKHGLRVAFMAPTEILARQHYATLNKVLGKFKIKIGLLTGAEKINKRDGDLLVGTHALISARGATPAVGQGPALGGQKNTGLENLGLVVVDEQHRFGVEQRAMLTKKQSAKIPHFLSMSATPIPRTLALTIYGDLDISILDEMPKERKKIITEIVQPKKRHEAYDFIREEIKRGRQVFVVCPRIDLPEKEKQIIDSRKFQQKLNLWEVKAVKEEYQKLSEKIFPDLRVAMLHGKIPARGGSLPYGWRGALGRKETKESIMEKFRLGETDILVSTSIIEVGVDVPNATIMMIEGAERFGLAQLHQFRGRVGRGAEQSYCLLFPTEDGMVTKRLRALVETENGFELAEKDLEIRGAGELLGVKQWGDSKILTLAAANPKMTQAARSEALEMIQKNPSLENFPELLRKIKDLEKVIHPE